MGSVYKSVRSLEASRERGQQGQPKYAQWTTETNGAASGLFPSSLAPLLLGLLFGSLAAGFFALR
jgi:hypothetical protein